MRSLASSVLFAGLLFSHVALGQAQTVTVSGNAGPWDQTLNPNYDYGIHNNTGPTVIDSTLGISFDPGAKIVITYVSGGVSGSNSPVFFDANGYAEYIQNPTNTYMGVNGVFPSHFINVSTPVNYLSLVGTFAQDGVIVGSPFFVGNGPSELPIPSGANQLLLGICDNYFADNSGSLKVSVSHEPAPQDGLVAYFPFDGDTIDVTGNGHNGSILGDVLFTEGVLGQAASFDGEGDMIVIPTAPDLRTAHYTVSLWAKTSQEWSSVAAPLFGSEYHHNSYDGNGYELVIREQRFAADQFTRPMDNLGAWSGHGIADGAWRHLVASWDGESSRVFVNGELAGEFRTPGGNRNQYHPGPVRWTAPYLDFVIGYHAQDISGRRYFNGSIDELRVYDRALSNAQVKALYHEDILPELPGKIAYYSYKRDGNAEIFIRDSSGIELRLTDHPGSDILPRISPDGKWVAFHSNRTGFAEVFKVPVEGGEAVQLTEFRESGPAYALAWHPSGDKLVFSTSDGLHFWEVPADGSKQTEPLLIDTPSKPHLYYAQFSYDGTKLFTIRRCCHAAGDDEVYVSNPDGSGSVNISKLNGQTLRGPSAFTIGLMPEDGQERILFSIGRFEGAVNVYKMNPDGSNQVQVTKENNVLDIWPNAPSGMAGQFVFQRSVDPVHPNPTANVWWSDLSGGPPVQITFEGGYQPHWWAETNLPPNAKCQDVSRNADTLCSATATPEEISDGSYDPDGGPISMSLDPAGPYSLGEEQVTLLVEDSQGASDSCQATITVVDQTPPPGFAVAALANGEANEICQAEVPHVSVSGLSDNCDPHPEVSQFPVEGTLVGLGTHNVSVVATDESGNATDPVSVDFTVVDQTPPEVDCPDDLEVDSTSPEGTTVGFSVETGDNCSVSEVTCSPQSDSLFSIGTTSVECTVTDGAGLAASCGFSVNVLSPEEQVENLMRDVVDLIDGGTLNAPTGNGLLPMLSFVLDKLSNDQSKTACNKLGAFIQHVTSLAYEEDPPILTPDQAQELTAGAATIKAAIGCE